MGWEKDEPVIIVCKTMQAWRIKAIALEAAAALQDEGEITG
jgi:hypothetical protein